MLQALWKKLKQYIYAEVINGTRYIVGLLPDKLDVRDFKITALGLGVAPYQPSAISKLIPSVSIKDQGLYSTCQWNATTSQQEDNEKIALSVEEMVAFGQSIGLVGANGVSDLSSGQKVLQQHGVAEDKFFPNPNMNNFASYSSPSILNPSSTANAATHKTKTYWVVSNRDATLQLIDQGKTLTTGMMWYSGFNMGGGFSAPWLIKQNSGTMVEGHAFKIKGYVKGYIGIGTDKKLITGPSGVDVYVCQNSFGQYWGGTVIDDGNVVHQGLFFIAMDFLDKVGYTRYTNMDIEYNLAKFLSTYDGKDVKGDALPAIYRIQAGKKRVYPDWVTFLSFGGQKGAYQVVPQAELDAIGAGSPMDITQSQYYPMIKDLSAPDNLTKLLSIIHQQS